MALNEKVVEHMRKNLGYNMGGGLHLQSENAQLIDTPILAIGLGGTGADSLIRLKNLINERLNTNSDKDKPDNIEYLVLDTDPRTKQVVYNNTTFSEAASETCILEDAKLALTYESICGRNSQFPHISEWISHELDTSQITNGAGGVRQVGRFLFFKEFARIQTELSKKISKITYGKSTGKKVYVFLVTGISGGTGSGTFIDLPYVIRSMLEKEGFEAQILGFIFLPDVNIQALDVSDRAKRRNTQRNGYAALKELDYLMNLGKGGNGEKFEQHYGGNFRVSFSRAPYDICHLVSSINQAGVNRYSKEDSMAVVAETILNFVADEENVGDQFTIAQYVSNISDTTNGFVSDLDVKRPINYKYSAIGSSSGILPMDDILNYLTHLLFKEMASVYDHTPTKNDVTGFVQKMNIGIENIEGTVTNSVYLQDIELYNYDNIKSDPYLVENVLKSSVEALSDIMGKNADAFMVGFKENSKKNIEAIFVDLDKGPSYASRLIYSTDSYCLLQYIREQRDNEILNRKSNEYEIKRLKDLVKSTRDKLTESKPILGFNKEGMAREHKKACVNLYSTLLRNLICDYMGVLYDRVYDCLNSANEKMFNVFTEMLNNLKNIFVQYADIANRTETETRDNLTLFSWHIIDTSALVSEIKLMIDDDPDFKMSFKLIIDNFVKELINHASEWLDETKPNIAGKLNKFIVSSFSNVARQSIDFYIKRIAGGDPSKEESIVHKAIQKLTDNAKVTFPLSIFGSTLNAPPYKYVSVPFDTQIFNKHLTGTIKKSVITNRLFMLNVNIAYPLMAYRELESYEGVYMDFYEAKEGAGMHLYARGDKNWKELPSPIYDKSWSSDYSNPKQKQINDKIREVFDKAIKYGYIKWDDRRKKFIGYYSNVQFDTKSIKEKYSSDAGASRADMQKALNHLKESLKSESRFSEEKELYDVHFDRTTNEVDMDYVQGIFIQMPTLNRKIGRMVDEHERMLECIKLLEKKREGFDIYNKFAAILYTGLIRKKRANFIYENSKQLEKALFTVNAECPDTYYEYYMFNAFAALDESERKFLYNRSQNIINQSDDAEVDKCVESMQSYFENFTEKRNTLASEYEIIIDGLKKADFYGEMRDEMQKAITLYSE